MIVEYYEFIDVNQDGYKERKLTATTELYNKLSAEETNRFKDKINEIIDVVNFSKIPLFPAFALKFKGDGNLDNFNIEVGDIVHGFYDANTIWDNARYLGGDLNDKNNYELIVVSFKPQLFTSTGASNDFALPAGMLAKSVYIDRGMRYKGTEWSQSGNTLVIEGATLAAGKKIYVIS